MVTNNLFGSVKYTMFLLFSFFVLLLSGCQNESVMPASQSSSKKSAKAVETQPVEDAVTSSLCTCPSGWDCRDFDQNSAVRQTGVPINYYNNEVGYTQWSWPSVQKNAREGFLCWYDKDHRLYSNNSYFANPANAANIRLRKNNGGGYPCSRQPYADYLTAGAGHPLYAAGTQYIRVVIGESCYTSDMVLVGR